MREEREKVSKVKKLSSSRGKHSVRMFASGLGHYMESLVFQQIYTLTG